MDIINIGTTRSLTTEQAVDQTIVVTAEYSSDLSVKNFLPDGLSGMSFQLISAYNVTPVFESFVFQGQTDEPVFIQTRNLQIGVVSWRCELGFVHRSRLLYACYEPSELLTWIKCVLDRL